MRNKRIATLAVIAYLISMVVSTGAMADGNEFQLSESDLSLMCVSAAYPAVTRGNRDLSEFEKNSAEGDERQNGQELTEGENTAPPEVKNRLSLFIIRMQQKPISQFRPVISERQKRPVLSEKSEMYWQKNWKR